MTRLGRISAAGLLAACVVPTPVHAEMIDLSTTRCGQFINSDKKEIEIILTWLDAYYKGEDDPPVIDTDKLLANTKKLSQYCAANPSIGLITATDKLFSK